MWNAPPHSTTTLLCDPITEPPKSDEAIICEKRKIYPPLLQHGIASAMESCSVLFVLLRSFFFCICLVDIKVLEAGIYDQDGRRSSVDGKAMRSYSLVSLRFLCTYTVPRLELRASLRHLRP